MSTALINYKTLQITALGLITSLGSAYRLVRPSISGDIVLASSVYGTFESQATNIFAATGGGGVVSGKSVIYLPVIKNGKVVPEPEDRLIQGTNGWRIIEVVAIKPDGKTPIMYNLTVT